MGEKEGLLIVQPNDMLRYSDIYFDKSALFRFVLSGLLLNLFKAAYVSFLRVLKRNSLPALIERAMAS